MGIAPLKGEIVIVSKGNYLLDGHHRIAAIYNMDNEHVVHVIKVNAKIQELFHLARAFEKTQFLSVNERNGYEEHVRGNDK